MGMLSKFPLFVSLLQSFYGSKILYLNNNLQCPVWFGFLTLLAENLVMHLHILRQEILIIFSA